MQSDLNIFKPLLQRLARDHRITAYHIALVLAIMQLSDSNDPGGPIYISRKRLIELSHIGSIVTYHKCIKELIEFRIIYYYPSYHPGIRSRILIVR